MKKRAKTNAVGVCACGCGMTFLHEGASRERRYYGNHAHRVAVRRSRLRKLGRLANPITEAILSDLGRVYEPDFSAQCLKRDYSVEVRYASFQGASA